MLDTSLLPIILVRILFNRLLDILIDENASVACLTNTGGRTVCSTALAGRAMGRLSSPMSERVMWIQPHSAQAWLRALPLLEIARSAVLIGTLRMVRNYMPCRTWSFSCERLRC